MKLKEQRRRWCYDMLRNGRTSLASTSHWVISVLRMVSTHIPHHMVIRFFWSHPHLDTLLFLTCLAWHLIPKITKNYSLGFWDLVGWGFLDLKGCERGSLHILNFEGLKYLRSQYFHSAAEGRGRRKLNLLSPKSERNRWANHKTCFEL